MPTKKQKYFDELPRSSRAVRESPIDWVAEKEAMIARPEVWTLIAENVTGSTATQLKRGSNKQFRGDDLKHFVFQTVKPENPPVPYAPKRTDLYGMYLPTGKMPKAKAVSE